MAMRDKIEHAIQNQPCTVKDLKNKFGGDRGACLLYTSGKRVLAVYAALLLGFAVVLCRLYLLALHPAYAARAAAQSLSLIHI